MTIVLFLILAFVAGAVLVFLLLRFKKPGRDAFVELQSRFDERVQTTHKMMLEQMNEITRQVSERLKENVDFAQRAHHATAEAVGKVGEKMAHLEEQTKRIFEVGKDIAGLQDILRAPKLRGILGEMFLGDLLGQILPKEHFALQYRFKSGEQVDALITIREDVKIPVDAKFPLENFRKYLAAQSDEERSAALRAFIQDVKKHIDAIAKKYIVPAENTTDFAMMYIPAENVYYEVFIADPDEYRLVEYAFSKRVIPISPNSFYAYLQAVLSGLRGMQIERGARDILQYVSELEKHFSQFSERFRVLGSHVRDAEKSYDQAERQLDRFGESMTKIGQRQALPEGQPKETNRNS